MEHNTKTWRGFYPSYPWPWCRNRKVAQAIGNQIRAVFRHRWKSLQVHRKHSRRARYWNNVEKHLCRPK